MFRTVAVLALAAIAVDAQPETISLFKTNEAITHLEATSAYTAAVTPEINKLVSDLQGFSEEAAAAAKFANDGAANALTAAHQELLRTVSDLDDNATEAVAYGKTEQAKLEDELSAHVESKLEELEEFVSGALNGYQQKKTWANSTDDPKYGNGNDRNYELIQVAIAPANTENGHAGRVMYKIKFNVNNPGFWYPNREELHRGCSQLSEDLKSLDGIDRGIKPACDTDWACDGNSVALRGSYLSNCGCGSRPRNRECIGMSKDFLGGSAMYNRYHSWNGCWMLRHDSIDCHHHWAHCYSNSDVQAEHTICTSSNNNKNKPPKGWCNPDDGKCY
jgi:hypothetical protein